MAKCAFIEMERLLAKSCCKEFKDAYRTIFFDYMLKGEHPDFIEVDTQIYVKAMLMYFYNLEEDLALQKTAFLNNLGSSLEKEGKIEEAIKVYEENAKIGYEADHCYERLRIIYKRLKRFEDMERIIERKHEVYSRPAPWQKEEIKRYFDR